jgi:Protein of unknown function (DUF3489)
MSRTTPKRATRRPAISSSITTQDTGATPPPVGATPEAAGAGGSAARAKPDAVTPAKRPSDGPTSGDKRLSKLDRLVAMLRRPDGACLTELAGTTGWQAHSIRGAIAGNLKRKGHVVISQCIDGVRRYRIEVLP